MIKAFPVIIDRQCPNLFRSIRIGPQGGTSILRGGEGAWTSHQVWRQNLGQGSAKFTKQKEKLRKLCHRKTQSWEKSLFWGHI